jgi:hypothetical protein
MLQDGEKQKKYIMITSQDFSLHTEGIFEVTSDRQNGCHINAEILMEPG